MLTLAGLTLNSAWLWVMVTCIGLVALLFTQYRYVVGYFLAGMLYWLGIEGMQWLLTAISSLNDFHAYILAIALSLIPVMLALAVKDNLISRQNFNIQLQLQRFSQFVKSLTRSKAPTRPSLRTAGQKPFTLEEDTDFAQHFIRHTPVFDYKN